MISTSLSADLNLGAIVTQLKSSTETTQRPPKAFRRGESDFGRGVDLCKSSPCPSDVSQTQCQAAELPLFRMATVCLGKRLDEGGGTAGWGIHHVQILRSGRKKNWGIRKADRFKVFQNEMCGCYVLLMKELLHYLGCIKPCK